MDSEALKPILAGLVRHGLTTLGGALVAGGYIQSSDVSAFIGGGMVVAGIIWSWWQKEGQAEVSDLLKKLTATKTKTEAVKAAEVLPPRAAVDTASKAASVQSVVNVLLIAFALSLFLAGAPAFAQTHRLPLTGNIAKDIAAATSQSAAPTASPTLGTGGLLSPDELIKKIIALAAPDLAYSAAMASSANTNSSTVRLACIKAIQALNTQASGANLKNADGSAMAPPAEPHIFTDLETIAEGIDSLSPTGPLYTSCAGAAALAQTNVLTFINQVVTGTAAAALVVPK